jgi:hypothetical protein
MILISVDLPRAVLADQRVYLAGIERQRHILQRLRGVEALGDMLHFENRADFGWVGHEFLKSEDFQV